MKTKKPIRQAPRARRGAPVVDEAAFTVVLEDLRAQFRVFGEALQELPTRREMHEAIGDLRTELRAEIADVRAELGEVRTDVGEMRTEMGEMRTDIQFLKTAVLDLAKRIP